MNAPTAISAKNVEPGTCVGTATFAALPLVSSSAI